jgi:TolB-like protein/AraC-like DNA-binding protein/Tfp pilus assembly protein PilF
MNQHSPANQALIEKLTGIVLANLTSEEFAPQDLAKRSGLSYNTLRRRIKSIKGITISEFIREVRLKRAMEMIMNDEGTAAEIAYKTGFNSPAYFSRCFHDFYGITPGKVKKGYLDGQTVDDLVLASHPHRKKKAFQRSILQILVGIIIVAACSYLGYNIYLKSRFVEGAISDASEKKTIAVLPFVNFSQDKENEYFCMGITDEVLNQLFKISDLKVKSRISVEKYRNTLKDSRTIGKELGVSLIMEGSVRKQGDDLRITVQLIDSKTGNHLWSETYDGKYTPGIFEFQSNIAMKVAESTNSVITPPEKKRLDLVPTSNMRAHDLYLKGLNIKNYATDSEGENYIRLALNLFNLALRADPNHPGALIQKSRCLYFLGQYDSSFFYARKCLEIDRYDPRAQADMAHYYFYNHDSDSALKYWTLTLESPNYEGRLWSFLGIGQIHFFQKNDPVLAVRYYQKAYDSGGDTLSGVTMNIGMFFYAAGNYMKAYRYYMKALYSGSYCYQTTDPFYSLLAMQNYKKAGMFLDSIKNVMPCNDMHNKMKLHLFIMAGNYDSADYYLNITREEDVRNMDLYRAWFQIKKGKKWETEQTLRRLITQQEGYLSSGRIPWVSQAYEILAAAYAMTGDKIKCFENLSKLETTGFSDIPYKYDLFPGFDYLRNDPDFKKISDRLDTQRRALRTRITLLTDKGDINL